MPIFAVNRAVHARRLHFSAMAVLLVIYPFFQFFATRSLTYIYPLACILFFTAAAVRHWGNLGPSINRTIHSAKDNIMLLSVGALIVIMTIACFRSETAVSGLKDPFVLSTFCALLFFTTYQMRLANRVHWQRIFMLVVIFTSVMLYLEMNWITRLYSTWDKSARPDDLNRYTALLATVVWSILCYRVQEGRFDKVDLSLKYLAIGAVYIASFLSYSQAAKFALVMCSAAWLVGYFAPKSSRLLLPLSCAFMLIFPFLVSSLAPLVAYFTSIFKVSGSPDLRMAIWRGYAEKALEKPLFGWGAEMDRQMSEHPGIVKHSKVLNPDIDGYHHTHSLIMEIWFNYGLMGCLSFCAILLSINTKLWPQSTTNHHARIAAFSLFLVGITATSPTQGWFLATVFYVCAIHVIFSAVVLINVQQKPQ